VVVAILVDLQHVSARRSDRVLFEDLSLTVSDGDRIGVVGINGTGKSTLLRLVAGVDSPEEGQVLRGRAARVGYLDQDPTLPPGLVRDAVGDGWEARAVLERLGMSRAARTDVGELSGGEAKRVALAAVLAHGAELLVLDEPTNHLDLPGVSWLERQLLEARGGLVLVSHDRHLLDRVTTRMLELDRGHRFMHDGGYASYLDARAEREERAASAETSRRNLARRELAWLRRGAPARTRKPRARIDAAVRVVEERAEAPARASELELSFGTPRLGDQVVECSHVGFSYDAGGPKVLDDVGLVLEPRGRLGVVGGNGTGKSTLLDLLAGRKMPDEGRVVTGTTVRVGYYDQTGADLDPDARVREVVAGETRVPGAPEDVALMERFWFNGELPFARVSTLSGGERRRLQLLLVLVERPNVLLLDEPTNDLDLDTIRILEDFFEEWPGSLVVVSHDRTFLRRTTERLVALERGGKLTPVAGGLDAWIARSEGRPEVTSRTRPSSPRARVVPVEPRARSGSTVGRELRDVERELARRQRQREQLLEALSGSSDHVELRRLGNELTSLQPGLDELEERWLRLAEEAESAR
jgi:ATP-binding cassette subfamily F protein uup